jgi:hypothetical protein
VTVLAVAVVFIGLLCLFNLLLTVGVIRRLREYSEARPAAEPISVKIAEVGSFPASFDVLLTDGSAFSSDRPATWTIVAFFSDSCQACKKGLPTFVRRAKELHRDDQAIVSVVVGEGGSTEELVSALEPVSGVTVEPYNGPLAKAFDVGQFPALCMLDESGVVVATGWDLDSLLMPRPEDMFAR